MKPRHNEDEIQLGIALFKKVCSDARSKTSDRGITYWAGTTCEGGGWTMKHLMNEDSMTPVNVAKECDLKSILRPAKAAYDAAILEATRNFLNQ